MNAVDADPVISTGPTYEMRTREGMAKTKLATMMAIGQSMGSIYGPDRYRQPAGFGHAPRKSTIKAKERKNRTAKKKAAKHSRRRNK